MTNPTDAVAQSREKRTRHFIVIDEKPMTNAEQEAALEIITHHLLDGTERGRRTLKYFTKNLRLFYNTEG